MDRICLQSSTCESIRFLVSLDVRISKEKVDGFIARGSCAFKKRGSG